MSRSSAISRRAAALAVVLPAVLAVPAGAAVADPGSGSGSGPAVQVVARGLANPRHLVVDRHGDVYVAEAGRGATDPTTAPCVESVNPETGETESFCYGATGAITKIEDGRSGRARRVVTGLPSVAGVTGAQAGGVSDLTVPYRGKVTGVVNLGGDPRDKAAFVPAPALASAGHVISMKLGRKGFRIGADVSAYEAANNPDAADPGSAFDSNPYGITAGRRSVVVADAGANALLRVGPRGGVSLVATFPAQLVDAPPFLGLPPGTKIPMQAVPNSVERGPDGAFYVGQLTGFPFPIGAASVWRVVPGQAPTVWATGFTNIIDLAFDRRGNLLVLEIASRSLLDPTSPGALYRVGKDGSKRLVTDALSQPGGVAVGDDGAAYVTNLSTSPDGGQVLRVRLPR